MTASATLRRAQEVDDAIARLRDMGLAPHPDVREKNWDLALALASIAREVPRTGRVLDVGARWSPILERMEALGYLDIWACDVERSWRDDLRRLVRRSAVRFQRADLTDTRLPAASFDAVTSMSVIEHGVVPHAYFSEMARILRRGGLLITSTDYWCEPVATAGIYPYGPRFGEMRVFDPGGIRDLVRIAEGQGFYLDGDLDLGCEDRVVTWGRIGLSYTFTYLELHRA